jgi:hypothetical protein
MLILMFNTMRFFGDWSYRIIGDICLAALFLDH